MRGFYYSSCLNTFASAAVEGALVGGAFSFDGAMPIPSPESALLTKGRSSLSPRCLPPAPPAGAFWCWPAAAASGWKSLTATGRKVPYTCTQCDEAWCLHACPVDAITVDKLTGAKLVNETTCVGCKVCTISCPFGTINYSQNTGKVVKCDLCGGDPQVCETETRLSDDRSGVQAHDPRD